MIGARHSAGVTLRSDHHETLPKDDHKQLREDPHAFGIGHQWVLPVRAAEMERREVRRGLVPSDDLRLLLELALSKADLEKQLGQDYNAQ